jgi:integrase
MMSRYVYVRAIISRLAEQECKETEPKTRASRRVIVLPAMVVDALRGYRVQQEKKRIEADEKWIERGLVFCTDFGDFVIPDYTDRDLYKLLVAAGLPDILFHDLRATMLLVAGVHPKVVQERLGHSSIVMTMDTYSHVVPTMQQEAAKKIDDMLKDL